MRGRLLCKHYFCYLLVLQLAVPLLQAYFLQDSQLMIGRVEIMANEAMIWDFLMSKGLTEEGTAGVMGNLFAESALNPKNLQNSYQASLGFTDETYTAAVDNGAYTKQQFCNDKAGYGLAQWTSAGRKEGLYNYWKANDYNSVGNLEMQLNYLWAELVTYSGLMDTLTTTDNICTAASAFMLQFERPADQSQSAQATRCNYAIKYYNQLATGETPGKPDIPPNPPTPATSGLAFYIKITNAEGNEITYIGTQLGEWIYFNDLRHYRMTNTGDRFQIFMKENDWKEYTGFSSGGLQLISINAYIYFENGVPRAAVEYSPFLY